MWFFLGKQINISVTLVSESYVILYCEKNVICISSIKICLKKKEKKMKGSLSFICFYEVHSVSVNIRDRREKQYNKTMV